MRLNKYIAHAGIASRRKADDLIANGNVKVNGITVKEMGYDVLPDDTVEVIYKAGGKNGLCCSQQADGIYHIGGRRQRA